MPARHAGQSIVRIEIATHPSSLDRLFEGVRASGRATHATRMTVNEEVLDALLSASRVMVSLAARSLADIDSEVTLSHYRALVAPARPAGHRIVLLVRRTAVVVGVRRQTAWCARCPRSTATATAELPCEGARREMR
jgi:hypothetical protein